MAIKSTFGGGFPKKRLRRANCEPGGLVLSRRVGEKIVIDEQITILVLRATSGKTVVNIKAPPGISIRREELGPTIIEAA